MKLGELLSDTFAGEWGSENGEPLTPVLRTSNFTKDGGFDYDKPAWRCVPENKVLTKRMIRGDVVLEKSGGTPKRPVGIMAFYDSDDLALCSNFNQILRFDHSKIQPKFAFHQLRWLKEKNAFERYTRKTTGLQNLEMKKLVELALWVPNIDCQTEIANTLDTIIKNQHILDQQTLLFDTLVKSRFVEMFGDPVENPLSLPCRNLGSLGELKNGMNFRKDESGIEVRCLGVADFGDRSELKNISSLGTVSIATPLPKQSLLKDGDIVFVRSNGNKRLVGRCMAVYPGGNEVAFSGFCIRLRVTSEDVRIPYLVSALKQASIRETLVGRGANIQNLTQGILGKARLPIPPLEDQDAFLDFAAQVDKSRFVARQQLKKLQELCACHPSISKMV